MNETTSTQLDVGITLREVEDSDLPFLFEQQRDPDSTYMAGVGARNKEEYAIHIQKVLADPLITMRTIVYDGWVAGHVVSFVRLDQLEVGYWIDKAYWGKGIASTALSQFLAEMTARPLIARVVKDNVASLRVLKKNGFMIAGEEKVFSTSRGDEVDDVILTLQ